MRMLYSSASDCRFTPSLTSSLLLLPLHEETNTDIKTLRKTEQRLQQRPRNTRCIPPFSLLLRLDRDTQTQTCTHLHIHTHIDTGMMSQPWRIYVGAEIPAADAPATSSASASAPTAAATRELLDTAFARRSRLTLATTPLATRQHPSSAASPVLRWLLQMEGEKGKHAAAAPSKVNTDSTTTVKGKSEASVPAVVAPALPAAQVAPTALARRGVGPKDPLLQRLLKKQQQQANAAASAATSNNGATTSTTTSSTSGSATAISHWTQHPYSAMSATSWRVFRQQLGITVELVAPARLSASAAAAVAQHSLPAADGLPAIRCWEEAQLPLSLGRSVTRLYALPTAVQAQCVPLSLLAAPLSTVAVTTSTSDASPTTSRAASTAAVASSLGMDVLAVAETGSGKTAAYLVPLLSHVLCRAPKLLGHPDRISLGPLALVIVPTRELAEQVMASLLLLCGQAGGSTANTTTTTSAGVGRSDILAWEKEEEADNNGSNNGTSSSSRNRLSEVRVVKVVGGESREAQYNALAQGAHCVVGTVGQLQMLLEDRLLSLGNSQFVVMDEADRMIDEQQESKLVAVLQRCPVARQTLMFTATLSAACAGVAKRYLSKAGYYMVRTPYRCASIRQSFELVSTATTAADDAADAASAKPSRPPRQQRRLEESGKTSAEGRSTQQRRLSAVLHPQKFARLVAWLVYGSGPIIVFANEKTTCDALFEELRAEAEHLDAQQEYFTLTDLVGPAPDGLVFREMANACAPPAPKRAPSLLNLTSTAVVHSELSQNERRALVGQFQRRQRQVLITTDLLARGLDVSGVTLVVNYDLPWTLTGSGADAVTLYIHRIGRTGRAGSTGVTVSFVALPAAMVQRAEDVVKEEAEAGEDGGAQKASRGGRTSVVVGDDDDDDLMSVMGELFDGDTRSVWATGRAAEAGGEDAEEAEQDGGRGGVNASDSDGEEDKGKVRGQLKRRRGAAKTAESDMAVLRPLWSFLTECAEGEGIKDGAAALRKGSYAKISVPPALACIMAQLSATSQFGHITL